MSRTKSLLFTILLLLSGSIINNGSADAFLVVGANYSTDKINAGDTVIFTGSLVSNSSSSDTTVVSMNVTLGFFGSKTKTARFSKIYDTTRNRISINETITDSIRESLDFEGGEYNVSIFFDIKDSSHTTPNKIQSYYVMTNQSLLIRGINDPTLAISVTLVIVVVIIIGFVFFSTRKK